MQSDHRPSPSEIGRLMDSPEPIPAMPIEIGIVGAGHRGRVHAEAYESIEAANVVAVADIDEEAVTTLAEEFGVSGTYAEYHEMLDDANLDAVSVCVHNNLHAPITVAAAEAGCHVFCEKPLAATCAEAERMVEAIDVAGTHLGVQNTQLFAPETRAARTLIDQNRLGEVYYGRAVHSRRRGRPYVDGYGTPAFVSSESAGGGAVIDIGTYDIGQLLYLLGNASVERVSGQTFDQTDDAYAEALVGEERATYTERLDESGYDVEDAGIGTAHLADGSVLSLRAAWHMYLPDEPSVLGGTQGGIRLDPFEFYTTTADYETTVSFDLDEHERRQGLLDSRTGYDAEGAGGQFAHWIATLRGETEDPIPTGEIAHNSMVVMEGIYQSAKAGHELSADEVIERSQPT